MGSSPPKCGQRSKACLNAICGEPGASSSPIRGTTRDTIDTSRSSAKAKPWKLHLTPPAYRRRPVVSYGPEYFGITRSFRR